MERLPGFRDFYPEPVPHKDLWSADTRRHIFDMWRKTARSYGFREYDGPPLEPLDLFTTKSGDEIVGQLYDFTDKGGREVALRPEMTPTLARMAAAHTRNYKKPMKWYAVPQLFRYERQQRGRLREHFQFNADVIGEPDPAADAELIALLIDSLRGLGLTKADFCVRLSSRQAWRRFFQAAQGDPNSEYEFYQTVDKIERVPPEESDKKLQRLGFTLDHVTDFIEAADPTPELQQVLDSLAARGMGGFVKTDYRVIRGLAYYTGIVFEAFDKKGEFRAIAGGGRYDNLIKLISHGKVDLPALGFGMGDVVLTELLKARGLLPEQQAWVTVFCLIEDESDRAASLRLVQDLRTAGIATDYPMTACKPNKQFKLANELKARATVQIDAGADSARVRVKWLATRSEETLPVSELITKLTPTAA